MKSSLALPEATNPLITRALSDADGGRAVDGASPGASGEFEDTVLAVVDQETGWAQGARSAADDQWRFLVAMTASIDKGLGESQGRSAGLCLYASETGSQPQALRLTRFWNSPSSYWRGHKVPSGGWVRGASTNEGLNRVSGAGASSCTSSG
eukprot:CAMPEP_0175998204 /NCGR_PEP_ID=MMETSP0108-20121206/56603_1 /TAXON_ID=195067 ORGANISM="Goniomonas pacifica, Strain CCMP1869" /NCGR_SAMPLE_ID=MMETSP0108 /ASSEMBLY_ACC=CAM_ASM_000204 /LENGTH=151 /DNA_ID=CAMNT_0017330503 /DNA_START=85 /DNA_END=542 /DNA_ORIENTATION=-